jgi:transposase
VLGIDDWSIRRGHNYGTILVDLERHCRIDVLPDRKAETLANWLKKHPGIEVISRDRADAYAEGARLGAPNAIQVVDRWHLLKNLGDALQRFLTTQHEALVRVGRELTQEARREPAAQTESSVNSQQFLNCTSPSESGQSPIDMIRRARRERRLARYERVVELFRAGRSKRAIARELQIDPKTVRKFLSAGSFPERAQRRARRIILQAYKSYLEESWAKGCRNATQMYREIQQRGYRGSIATLRRLLYTWRDGDGRGQWKRGAASGNIPAVIVKAPSPRRAMWLLVRDVEQLDAEDQKMRDKLLSVCPGAAKASEIACKFQTIVRDRKDEELNDWVVLAKSSGIEALASFAAGLENEREGVEAALRLEWSNGQVEGQVNWIKTRKRQMFGRAKFDLLRRKILLAG